MEPEYEEELELEDDWGEERMIRLSRGLEPPPRPVSLE
jgi:hypothetical protein